MDLGMEVKVDLDLQTLLALSVTLGLTGDGQARGRQIGDLTSLVRDVAQLLLRPVALAVSLGQRVGDGGGTRRRRVSEGLRFRRWRVFDWIWIWGRPRLLLGLLFGHG